MNRENQRSQAGKSGIEIGFMDVNQMGPFGKICYLLMILSFIGAVTFFFYNKMVLGPESEELEKQKKFEQRKAAKLAKKKNWIHIFFRQL